MASASLEPGTLLNERYHILHALGQGGMGTVYKAEHTRLHSIVAIKEIRGLNADGSQRREELDQCEHEARFLVHLNHPNLPKVTDAFIENDCFYLVMEYIEGVTLDARMNAAGANPLDVMQCVDWGLQITDVLAYLHSQEPAIIFRDLKPSNVMVLPSSNIKLIDFGIARHFQPGASKDTSLLGSVGYSPPEQFGRGQTDPRSDVYAFGATMHHLLTARDPALQPFKFPPAHTFNPQVPQSLSHLLEMCLALDPDARPASISVVAVRLMAARDEIASVRVEAAAKQASLLANTPALALPNAQTPRHDPPLPVGRMGEEKRAAETPERPGVRVVSASQATTRSTPSRPAGASQTSPGPRLERRSPAVYLVPLLLAVIGGGVAVAMLNGRANSNAPSSTIIKPPLSVDNMPGGDDSVSNPTVGTPNTTAPDATVSTPVTASPGPGNPAMPATPSATLPNGNIRLQTALLPAANDMLPIAVSGTIQGQANTRLQLAVYFFDAKGQPLESSDAANGAYVNAQKYLCTYKTLTIASDEQAVLETLSLPARLLVNAGRPTPYTCQAMLFQEGVAAPIHKTSMMELPPSVYGGASVPAQPATSGQGGGSGTPHSVISPGRVGN